MKYIALFLVATSSLVTAQTTYYSNANGTPLGTAQSTQPIQPFQQAPMNAPSAPTFPTSPMFPSSPRGM
jgi:hypothetical protein